MKRFDAYKEIENKSSGAIIRDLLQEDFKKVNTDLYIVRVKCRKCGNIHDIERRCEVCDIETKVL